MMSMPKKINPRRVPASKADVNRARDKAASDAVHLAMAIFLTVLKDDMGFTNDQIIHVWNRVDKLSQEVAERRINVHDLCGVLESEYSITLE